MTHADEAFVRDALRAAEEGLAAGEVPVGAVVVRDGEVIARAHNAPIAGHDPTAHAEVLALRRAAERLGNYRLEDCELYVTLEPCPMCVGAILHARLKRVVYGATDPKAGACGSVVDLAHDARLNPRTVFEGDVLAEECGALLKRFFEEKRVPAEASRRILRTPDGAFEGLPGYPYAPRYLANLPGIEHVRIHYVDEGPRRAGRTFLCLHGNPTWSYLYRKMIPVFAGAGHRVVAPDLIGHGKSDKFVEEGAYSFSLHREMLRAFIERLDLRDIVLVCQDWGGLLGLTLPMDMPGRFAALVVMNTAIATGEAPLSSGFEAWRAYSNSQPDLPIGRLLKRGKPDMTEAEAAAYDAPYPDASYKASVRAFPNLVPGTPEDDGAALGRRALDWWAHAWQGRSFMAIGEADPVLGAPVMEALAAHIRGCPAPLRLPEAGHFVPEWGEAIARQALAVFGDEQDA